MSSVTESLGWVAALAMAAANTMSEQEGVVLNGILDKEDPKTLPDLVRQVFMNASESNNPKVAEEILNKRKEHLSSMALLKAYQSFKGNEELSRKIFSRLSKMGAGVIVHHAGTSNIQTWQPKPKT